MMHIFYHWSYLVVNFISPVFCFAWFSSAIATHGQALTLRKCIVKIVTYYTMLGPILYTFGTLVYVTEQRDCMQLWFYFIYWKRITVDLYTSGHMFGTVFTSNSNNGLIVIFDITTIVST